jgi:hypothetical protein
MRAKTEMLAFQDASTNPNSHFNEQPYSGILSERFAIVFCGVGVAVFALPILVVIQVLSGLYWGGVSVYQLLNGSEFDKLDNI